MNIKTHRACVALSYLDPSCDRNTWVKYGMCLKHEFGDAGFDLWDEWSSRSDKYRASDARSTWKSIKADGSRTIATLFYDAKQAGWKDDTKHKKPTKAEIEARKAAAAARAEQAAKEEEEAHDKAAVWAQRLWSEAKPCESHPYLERKGVASYGLRVGRWERVNTETGEIEVVARNALLIPIQDRQRKIWGLQGIFVDPNSKKLYLKGCAKRGNFFAIGRPQQRDGRLVFILAEGYATAASVHAATGHMVFVCFDVSNLFAVARELRARQPEAYIVFAADNDTQTEGNPGLTKAREAAKAIGGLVAVPPQGDFNDMQLAVGREAVAACIESAFVQPIDVAPPKIELREGERASIIGELAAAFTGRAPYYRRGPQLVRAIILPADAEADGVWRSRGSVLLRQATKHAVIADASRYAKVCKFDRRSGLLVPKDLPESVAASFCDKAVEEAVLPPIVGVVRCPVMRQDGSLHTLGGYDSATKLILAGDEDWSRLNVPDRPTIDDAKAALQWLLDVPFADFPFADAASRSVAISALFTAILRPAIPCAPLHGFSAPQYGAGKSLLAEFVAIVATGAKPSMIAPGHNQEEFEKRVDSALIEGDPVVVLDNLSRSLAGDNLCASLTSDTAKVRRLGSSESITVRTSAFWMATGMNLSVKRDMHRRTVICYLDAQMAHPEARADFRIINLRDWAAENRMRILSCVYTILRAHALAGYPACGEGVLGNFEAWSRRVAHCLVWLGLDNPVCSQDRLRADDPEYLSRIALMRAIYAWQVDRESRGLCHSWTMKDLREVASQIGGNDGLREAISACVHNGIEGMQYWVRSNKNVTVNDGDVDYKLRDAGGAHGKVTRWEVVAVRDARVQGNVADEPTI